MKLVIDANILFAALIKEGITIQLLLNKDIELYSPNFVIEELDKHIEEILYKMKRDTFSFENKLLLIKQALRIVKDAEYDEFIEQAEQFVQDENDADYIALALKLRIPIWSNDKMLKKQKLAKVYNTIEIIEMFK